MPDDHDRDERVREPEEHVEEPVMIEINGRERHHQRVRDLDRSRRRPGPAERRDDAVKRVADMERRERSEDDAAAPVEVMEIRRSPKRIYTREPGRRVVN